MTTADELAAIRRRWEGVGPWKVGERFDDELYGDWEPVGQGEYSIAYVPVGFRSEGTDGVAERIAAAPADIHTLQALFDATNARLLVAYHALEDIYEAGNLRECRIIVGDAIDQIDAMKAELEARG